MQTVVLNVLMVKETFQIIVSALMDITKILLKIYIIVRNVISILNLIKFFIKFTLTILT